MGGSGASTDVNFWGVTLYIEQAQGESFRRLLGAVQPGPTPRCLMVTGTRSLAEPCLRSTCLS